VPRCNETGRGENLAVNSSGRAAYRALKMMICISERMSPEQQAQLEQ